MNVGGSSGGSGSGSVVGGSGSGSGSVVVGSSGGSGSGGLSESQPQQQLGGFAKQVSTPPQKENKKKQWFKKFRGL